MAGFNQGLKEQAQAQKFWNTESENEADCSSHCGL